MDCCCSEGTGKVLVNQIDLLAPIIRGFEFLVTHHQVTALKKGIASLDFHCFWFWCDDVASGEVLELLSSAADHATRARLTAQSLVLEYPDDFRHPPSLLSMPWISIQTLPHIDGYKCPKLFDNHRPIQLLNFHFSHDQ